MCAQAHAPAAARGATPDDPIRTDPTHAAADAWRRRLAYLGLFGCGAAISAFTIRRGIDPFDEGLMLQAARRIAGGQIPYADFVWPYGPGQPFLLAALFKLFGTSLLQWRIVRSVTDAAIALVVYALVRREAPRSLALVAWLTAACGIAQPTTANPFPLALLAGLLALAVATGKSSRHQRGLACGALVALAAAWRLDFGVYAGAAAAIVLALTGDGPEERRRTLGLYAIAVGGFMALVYLPFVILAGPSQLYDRLIGTGLREGGYWTLPFPLAYHGGVRTSSLHLFAQNSKDALSFYLPLLLAAGAALSAAAVALRWRASRSAPALWVGLLAFAAGLTVYMLSRTDEFHTGPLLVVLAALLALAIAWLHDRRRAPALKIGIAAVLALLLASGVANRASALLYPKRFDRLDLPVADGVKAAPADARSLPRIVRSVQRIVPPGHPIYVVSRRTDLVRFNDPLLYVLAERDNPTDRDVGLQTGAAAQRAIVATLRRARPLAIVRWSDPISSEREPNKRGRPSKVHILDSWIARNYVLREIAGYYQLLVPRLGHPVNRVPSRVR